MPSETEVDTLLNEHLIENSEVRRWKQLAKASHLTVSLDARLEQQTERMFSTHVPAGEIVAVKLAA